jgi:asparagine synthetase B (glutamine-hydrolysing)
MIDKLLQQEIQKSSSDKEVAVLLSGGVDSLSVAFAAQRLGKIITAYTFHLKGQPTYDSQKAEEASKIFGWDCKTIEIPTERLEDDFIMLAKYYNCVKKTQFECSFPFLYVYKNIIEHEVLSGWAADGYYGISKKAILHYTKDKAPAFFKDFRDNYFSEQNRAGYIWHNRIAEENGKKFITPYLTDSVKQFFYSKEWEELNYVNGKHVQKHHVREAFKDEFSKLKVKEHINLQLGSGVDKLFETLIDSKRINTKNRKRVMDIIKDWTKSVPKNQPKGDVTKFL